jgi:CRISPR/Cas system CSM-associated protein Csm2 small subunit
VLLAKLQEIRGPQQNPQVQLIYAEPRGEDPRVTIITRGGDVTGDDRITQGKITEDSGIRKATHKTQMFDAKKEREMFEESRKEFRGNQGSASKKRLEVREYGMPLEFDQSASPREGKEVSKLMEFLYTCIKLIQDENAVQELQNLIKQYELGKIDPLLNRAVHQIGKKRRTNKELHLNAQIGEYEIDYVVLDLGLEVNVMMKQT